MTEQAYQSKIIKAIEAIDGHVVNGNYSKAGEADLQCGYPVALPYKGQILQTRLLHLCIEVKTEKDYHRVMKALSEHNGQYSIIGTSLKKHEPMQVAKINKVRRQGGLALFAYDFKQVEEYINEK